MDLERLSPRLNHLRLGHPERLSLHQHLLRLYHPWDLEDRPRPEGQPRLSHRSRLLHQSHPANLARLGDPEGLVDLERLSPRLNHLRLGHPERPSPHHYLLRLYHPWDPEDLPRPEGQPHLSHP